MGYNDLFNRRLRDAGMPTRWMWFYVKVLLMASIILHSIALIASLILSLTDINWTRCSIGDLVSIVPTLLY